MIPTHFAEQEGQRLNYLCGARHTHNRSRDVQPGHPTSESEGLHHRGLEVTRLGHGNWRECGEQRPCLPRRVGWTGHPPHDIKRSCEMQTFSQTA